MKTEIAKLTQIQVNGANPRIIKDEKFDKLINSILVLPKMLELRPIVVDDTFVALGGNMRYRALVAISQMSIEEIHNRLSGLRDFQRKTEPEQERLLLYWATWKDNPTAPIIRASELSDDEQREFIIKDNVGYGEWDMDALANEWEKEDLVDWGLDDWDFMNDDDGSGSGGGDGTGSYRKDFDFDHRKYNRWGGLYTPDVQVLCDRCGYYIGRLVFDAPSGKWFTHQAYGHRHWQNREEAEAVCQRFKSLYRL